MSTEQGETSIHDLAGVRDDKLALQVREIEELRRGIDRIDASLIPVLAERFRLTERIGQIKAEANFAPEDSQRETEQIQRLRALAGECGLDPDIAESYLHLVAGAAKQNHLKLIKQLNS